jgi:Zn-finger nucleic acid-binding protein
VLLACTDCHRVYDVRDLPLGSKVRCGCGQLNEVVQPAPVERVMAHCGSCGGALESGSKSCAYCQARVSLLEEKLGDPCPHCVMRLPLGARFCPGCGRGVRPEAVVQALSDSTCPMCKEALRVVEGAEDPFHQCTSCGGLWLSKNAFDEFIHGQRELPATAEERRTVDETVRIGRRHRGPPLGPPCPVCQAAMFRHEFARFSGVCVDQCRVHGWWFDAGELERIATFARAGGLESAEHRRRVSRETRGRVRAWKRRIAEERRRGSDGFDLVDLIELFAD